MQPNMNLTLGSDAERTLTIDPIGLFKTVGKIVVKVSTGSLADAASEIPELVSAIGLRDTVETRFSNLVSRSLERALSSLVSEMVKSTDIQLPNVHAASFTEIHAKLIVQIDSNFFHDPKRSGLIEGLIPDAERWPKN